MQEEIQEAVRAELLEEAVLEAGPAPEAQEAEAAPAPAEPEAQAQAQAQEQAREEKPARAVVPPNMPAKFIDPQTREVRIDALVNSYNALERRLGQLTAPPKTDADKERLQKLLGKPESAQEYAPELPQGVTQDPEVDARLHKCGMTAEQVQEVYSLAGEKLGEAVRRLACEHQADREVERLIAHFGGHDKWCEVSRQLLAFGQNALPPHVLDNLACSFEGVLALQRMMTAGVEPVPSAREADNVGPALAADKRALDAMLHDPRYWKEKDPAFIAQVTEGFERLYGRQ